MAVFYTGPRPVTRGKNAKDSVHTWKGTQGTYSNWDLFNTSQILSGAPNEDHTPGSGRFPHGLKLSRVFTGAVGETQELSGSGHSDDRRYRPLENKAAGNSLVFKSEYGHGDRVTSYSLVNHYDNTNRQTYLDDPGHTERGIGEDGAAATFGKFHIYRYKGVTEQPMLDENLGTSQPTDAHSPYGRNKVNEWRGVESARVL